MAKGLTVRVTFRGDDGEPYKMLFGNSYKHWTDQATEYVYRTFGDQMRGWHYDDVHGRVIGVERSYSPWMGWGGLKWCDEASIQSQLNREGVQRDKPDNPHPRLYQMFSFDYSSAHEKQLEKELRKY